MICRECGFQQIKTVIKIVCRPNCINLKKSNWSGQNLGRCQIEMLEISCEWYKIRPCCKNDWFLNQCLAYQRYHHLNLRKMSLKWQDNTFFPHNFCEKYPPFLVAPWPCLCNCCQIWWQFLSLEVERKSVSIDLSTTPNWASE